MEPSRSMRIGRLAELAGVSTDLLRVWERRYGLLHPARSAGGYRLYGPEDLELVRRVVRLKSRGVSARDAVAAITGSAHGGPPVGARHAVDLVAGLLTSTVAFDEREVDDLLDSAVATFGVADTIHDVLMPFLDRLGAAWAAGRVTVAHEHFVSNLVRRRLGGLAVPVDEADAAIAVLACPPGERHDLVLLALGVLLSRSGWRVRFLGADTPVTDLGAACDRLAPDLVVLSGTREPVFDAAGLRQVAARWPLAVGGRGTDAVVAARLAARLLPAELRDAAALLGSARPARETAQGPARDVPDGALRR